MALFDRRLLSYFDDGGIAGSGTFQDRICEYQQDLCDIERELLKYQHLLGIHRVKVKARDRRHWRPPSRALREENLKHGEGHAASQLAAPLRSLHVVTQPHQVEQVHGRGSFSHLESTPSASSSMHGRVVCDTFSSEAPPTVTQREVKRGSRRLSKADSPGVEKHAVSGSVKHDTTSTRSPDAPARRASIQARRTSVRIEPETPSAVVNTAVPAMAVAAPVAVDPFLERLKALEPAHCGTHWAQVDTLFLSSKQAVPSDGKFVVRVTWLGKDKMVETVLHKEVLPNEWEYLKVFPYDRQDFPLLCKVREQLQLEAASDVRVIEVRIIQLTSNGEKVFGSVMLDALNPKHHGDAVTEEPVYNPSGQKLESYLKVKLHTATPPTKPLVVKQDPVAATLSTAPVVAPPAMLPSTTPAQEEDDDEEDVPYEEDAEEEPLDDDPEAD